MFFPISKSPAKYSVVAVVVTLLLLLFCLLQKRGTGCVADFVSSLFRGIILSKNKVKKIC
jgi:hypothetical protein